MGVDMQRASGAVLLRFGTGARANALSADVRGALLDALRQIAADPTARALLIQGHDENFSAGQDLKEHQVVLAAGGGDAVAGLVTEEFSALAAALDGLAVPTVAAIHGVAAGAGLGLALACDLRLAARSARFTTAFVGVGLAPDTGVSANLVKAVGHSRAVDLLMRPRIVDADEALLIGLVHEVHNDDALDARAREVVSELAAGPTVAYAQVKACLDTSDDLTAALAREAEAQRAAASTSDHAEAVEAFVNQRAPKFTGH
ncbi:MAG: enoyl-CoA hydratase-related protein [Candidatus Nanopelagicales bacterium]